MGKVKFLAILCVVAILSVGAGYFGLTLLEDNKEETVANNTENQIKKQVEKKFDKANEVASVHNLVKTYLISSSNFDWETVKVLSTGVYKDKLVEQIIPNANKMSAENKIGYSFNSRDVDIEIESISTNEAVVIVNYIISKSIDGEEMKSQEKIKLYLTKKDQMWLILSVESI